MFFFGGGGLILSSFEKWSNYVHSGISGTHGVKVTPFWAGTKPLIPGQFGQPLRNETERSRITYSRLSITRTLREIEKSSSYREFELLIRSSKKIAGVRKKTVFNHPFNCRKVM